MGRMILFATAHLMGSGFKRRGAETQRRRVVEMNYQAMGKSV